jgi:NAD(P) transhydrogenase subunit alpha
VPNLEKLGCSTVVESSAGFLSGYTDEAYKERGAEIAASRDEVIDRCDVLLTVRCSGADPEGTKSYAGKLRSGQVVLGHAEPYATEEALGALRSQGATLFALELIPRITRAQSMDVLSSMANLAGYKAAVMGANALPKMFPMMMTAAGTVVPARVFIVGVGVAGLQAIATAKRLGAVVSAYDIRPAVKEQVESLGARFVEMDLDTGSSETSGGYAREMGEEFYKKQRELMTEVVSESDVVITTASIPGKPAPKLVTMDMVEAMSPGSVIVDLAAERGGNCELTQAGQTVEHQGVHVIGPENVASTLAYHASQLYSKNLTSFLGLLVKEGSLNIDTEDEIIAATLVLRDGELVNEALRESEGQPASGEQE